MFLNLIDEQFIAGSKSVCAQKSEFIICNERLEFVRQKSRPVLRFIENKCLLFVEYREPFINH